MQTAQPGDRVQVRYVKRFQDGSVASPRGGAPLDLTVGVDHPRLPGLGLALVGLAPGASASVSVPPEQAYGQRDVARVRRLSRTRFPKSRPLSVGQWVRILDGQGRRRSVRILEVRDKSVVVDTNYRGAGQSMRLEVELLSIRPPESAEARPSPRAEPWHDDGGEA